MLKKIMFVLFLLAFSVNAITLKLSFFDVDAYHKFQSYITNQGIKVKAQKAYYYDATASGDSVYNTKVGTNTTMITGVKLKIAGDFSEYDIARIWNAIELIDKNLPLTYKTTDLIYFEIYMALDGNMEHVGMALKDMPLFPIFLNSYNYKGARDCISKMSDYLTPNEKNAILSIIPKQ